jgi:hypothetical protein
MLDMQTRNLMIEGGTLSSYGGWIRIAELFVYQHDIRRYLFVIEPSMPLACGLVDLWTCGLVDLWTCGLVDLWTCGLVDLWTNCAEPEAFRDVDDTTPREFLGEFAQQALKKRGIAKYPEDYDMDEYMEEKVKIRIKTHSKAAKEV